MSFQSWLELNGKLFQAGGPLIEKAPIGSISKLQVGRIERRWSLRWKQIAGCLDKMEEQGVTMEDM